jgi:hypothetical protein
MIKRIKQPSRLVRTALPVLAGILSIICVPAESSVLSDIYFSGWTVSGGGRLFCATSYGATLNYVEDAMIDHYPVSNLRFGYTIKEDGYSTDSTFLGGWFATDLMLLCPNHDPSSYTWSQCTANARQQGTYREFLKIKANKECIYYNGHGSTSGGTVHLCETYRINDGDLRVSNNCTNIYIPPTPVSCEVKTDKDTIDVDYGDVGAESLRAGLLATRKVILSCAGGADATVRITPPTGGIRLNPTGTIVSNIDVGFGDGQAGDIKIGDGESKTIDINVTTLGNGVKAGSYNGSGVITISIL